MSNPLNMNQGGPFWDFLASLENTDFSNHPFLRNFMPNNVDNDEHVGSSAEYHAGQSDRNMNTENAGAQQSTHNNNVNGDWDAFTASFPFAGGFPFGPRGGHDGWRGRGGFGGRGRGSGFGDGHRGRHGRHGPPGPPPPPPNVDHPMPPPPPDVHVPHSHDEAEDPPVGTPPSSDDEGEHGPESHRHTHGHSHTRHRGNGRDRGHGHSYGHRGGRHHGGPHNNTPFNMAALAEFLQSHFLGLNTNNNTTRTNPNGDIIPPIDLFSTPTSYIIDVSLPGTKKSDINVSYDNATSTLTISGVRHRNGDEELIKMMEIGERRVGAFERKVVLEGRVDGEEISAKLEEGVLRVVVGKGGEEERRRVVVE